MKGTMGEKLLSTVVNSIEYHEKLKQYEMKTIKLLIFSTVTFFAVTGCVDDLIIRGNGIAATEGRITPDFEKVKSEGAFDVHITKGDEFEVVVNAESNLLQYIETHVKNNTLRIYTSGLHSLNNRLPMEVYVTTPYLEGITQSGSGTISTGYFTAEHFDAVISGSGTIETYVEAASVDAVISGSGALTISGEAEVADFLLSGSGEMDAWDLDLHDCDATISGSGDIWIQVSHYLKAAISGSGNVFYSGSPSIETHISGSGDIIRQN
ncbi:DUF2807 domain-containing protein [Mariniphaga sediminis]|uniref:DUF2807 domain-containing protein n=2 Tax=Mariniphaga sediminis TaxID=1628158 RepID=A0A399D1W9_9BACT|nr:DUF2807 domain-containing protein [Mariniphaga sediminis]